ncbi:T9SS type B sorting domain-containing protein [Pontibacter beigongshangensis]|uniref:T9SS type B sorting domain-containing protein n=1 Tax=Pontibacter beigongshangensis TaxID=2574733 RepID=UPI0016504638|nr:gliding motility-associated C-terminal domain-containing protein [Pontibacter beigongshangensis]
MRQGLHIRFLLPHAWLFILVLLLLVSSSAVQATHIRAGDITAKRDTTPNPNPRRYFFTMVIYRDTGGVQMDNPVTIWNGLNNITVPLNRMIPIGNQTEKHIFTWETTYPADGTYEVSWTGINRNNNILNLQSPSEQHSFHITTTLNINSLRGYNSTPVLTVDPIDLAMTFRKWVHNPGAYDADGDSLAFKFRVPQRREGSGITGKVINVPGFVMPHLYDNCQNSIGTGPATFTLDPLTGQLEWDAPCITGEYNIAFVVEEWRVSPSGGAVKLGEVVRDMQILVRAGSNRPPILEPRDTCIVAGTTLNWLMRATDPDGDRIMLTASSGVIPPATFTQTTNTPGAAAGLFSWATQCSDVRDEPYLVVVRAEDQLPLGQRLADLQPWRITVVGPPPQNLVATGQGKDVLLTWDPYICQNASSIRIYRREGPSGFEPDTCQTGIPGSTGYVLIAEVGKDGVSYLDNNGGRGLESGKEYCYMIYAEFPVPGRGQSLASNEACVAIEQDIPYLTHVTVDATDATDGQVTVRWTQPGAGIGQLQGPFQYRLYRKLGQGPDGGQGYTRIASFDRLSDTVFVDRGLNTLEESYRYKLEFYHSPAGTLALYDSTSASSVRLELAAAPEGPNEIALSWGYQVPWENTAGLHRIYRRAGDAFVLIDSVAATAAGGTYTDRGTFGGQPLARGQSYCYYVETVGAYPIPGLPRPLENLSQQACALLPRVLCAPELSVDALDCGSFSPGSTPPPYQNVLTWLPSMAGDCTEEIALYSVYFRARLEGEWELLGTTAETRYVHAGLASFAGCYRVTATGVDGQESAPSNEVCKDNCLRFGLPNIITPNGDGRNDVFRPDRETGFVRSTRFRVYNRWGVRVFEGSGDPYINWGGTSSGGGRVSDGVYYYEAEVEFFSLDPARERQTFKGWVEVVR